MIILLGKHPPKMNKYIISPVSFVVICALVEKPEQTGTVRRSRLGHF